MHRIIKVGLCFLMGALTSSAILDKKTWKSYYKLEKKKNEEYRRGIILNQWIGEKQKNRNICDCLKKRNIHRVAILGEYNMYSKVLETELGDADISIIAYINMTPGKALADYRIISPDSIKKDEIDAVLALNDVQRSLYIGLMRDKGIPVIILEDMIFDTI